MAVESVDRVTLSRHAEPTTDFDTPSVPLFTTGILLGGLAVLVLAVAASVRFGVPFYMFIADGNAVAKVHPLVGILSYLGILLWWAAAAIWLFTAGIMRAAGRTEAFRFAVASGALTAYLALDDLFEFHEQLAPKYLGLSETVIYALLGIALVAYFVVFWKCIRATGFMLMVLAVLFLAASVGIDKAADFAHAQMTNKGVFEDGTKWLGIACWLGYCLMWARVNVLELLVKPKSEV